ncbi:hypothetical protein KL905_004652 [Ogataea polymorpha]|uniref:AAA+ ATPase domain-containing protein n=1 Tax=Ogataea polymorpha TaxID=460523 RepID=A0A9P8P3G1_9ASCO|nr:hypothetical protein KL935_000033 [Ogataea polymorpha]KAG7908602.1 hypothetical protein KL907_002092 [Ogataea polymorpha]KAG7908665.1 hypothetical protein KL906_002896 [Ogataea polymorpha]KAG7916249.1 hypothetical protein KL905_004652 [Ogataea polymorpha]KAH3664487.1 hypothetical protein OGATHE_003302 [Ogataea polymorpha]
MSSLLQFNFSSSLLAADPAPAPLDTETVSADGKRIVLSSGKRITLKPRKPRHLNLGDEKDQSQLINIHKLLSKLEVEEKAAEQTIRQKSKLAEKQPKLSTYKLWTEKYRPSGFLDLVGNERTNRQILQWINQWNQIVFGKPCAETSDFYNRPDKRVLLIHGPPGIGKTSIAHVISRQLGYEVREINASDERAGATVQDKIKNAMKNNSLTGSPVCLILDEVDGATEHGFINILVDLINKDRRDTASLGIDTKRRTQREIIKRPIIALCNDVYSPVLEKLRPHCETIAFRKSHPRLVKSKLKKICQREALVVDERVLDAIIESTEGDLRNCINFLQFNSSAATLNLESSSKDTQIGWFVLLDSIFVRNAKISKQEQFRKLIKSLWSSAQVDRVTTGCFNVMLDTDTDINKLSEMSDWLYFQDALSTRFASFEAQDFTFYQSAVPMKFYQKFNEISHLSDKRYNYRTRDRFFDLRKETAEALQKIKHLNNQANSFKLANRAQLVGYELNLLNAILVPDVPFKQIEMAGGGVKLSRIIELIEAYSLRVDVSKNEYGNATTQMRPGIHLFANLSAKQHQILVRLQKELLTKYIQGQESKTIDRKRKGPRDNDQAAKKSNCSSSVEYFKSKYAALTDQLSHAKSSKEISASVMGQNEYRIWVKYHEGFSNAVRRDITWENLFAGRYGPS